MSGIGSGKIADGKRGAYMPNRLPVTAAISQKRMSESVLSCLILRAADATRHCQTRNQQYHKDNHEYEE